MRIRFVSQRLLCSGSILPRDASLSSTPKSQCLNPSPAHSSRVELPLTVLEACIVGVRKYRGKMDGETTFVEPLGNFRCLFLSAAHSCYLSRPSPLSLSSPPTK